MKAWHSPADLAALWGVSRKTVLRAIRRGDLPAVRVGPQCIRVTPVDAAAFYAARSSGLGCPRSGPVGSAGDVAGEKRGA